MTSFKFGSIMSMAPAAITLWECHSPLGIFVVKTWVKWRKENLSFHQSSASTQQTCLSTKEIMFCTVISCREECKVPASPRTSWAWCCVKTSGFGAQRSGSVLNLCLVLLYTCKCDWASCLCICKFKRRKVCVWARVKEWAHIFMHAIAWHFMHVHLYFWLCVWV